MAGKPIIAIPLAYDQPAIAARLKRLHIAEVLPVMGLSSKRIREAITKVLSENRFHDSAIEMQSQFSLLHGTERAVDIIEESLDRYADRPPKPGANWSGSNSDSSSLNSESTSCLQR
jgi:UDP:flavonoid glycosyltransferase YjiC (YdhE family)